MRGEIMSIERLTAEDKLMLWPDEIWPQDIGALAATRLSAWVFARPSISSRPPGP
jgi:hypothetical protein